MPAFRDLSLNEAIRRGTRRSTARSSADMPIWIVAEIEDGAIAGVT